MSEYVEEGEEEEGEEEEASPEEKLQIVQHFLLNSPPGEFDEVKGDALALVQDDLVSPAMLAGIARVYNTAQLRVISIGEKLMVLCKEAELDATTYLDPSTGEAYTVDHLTLAATKTDRVGPESALTEERASIQAAIQAYVAAQYAGTACAGAFADETDSIKVVISGEKINLRNYWSGNWRSSWVVEVRGAQASLTGSLKVRAHYFEDGNVQLQTSKDVSTTISFTGDIGTAVSNAIAAAESALQQGLEDMYANMSHETFKAMRRVMPITRTKMKYVSFFLSFVTFVRRWNINEIALNRNLRK